MKTEINVFLKCQNCGTFITSHSFPVIKKHYNECRKRQNNLKIDGSSTRLPEANEDDAQFDMECDFIDEEMETVTLSQPFIILEACNLENSVTVKPELDEECQFQVDESCDIDDDSISVPVSVARKVMKGRKRKNKNLFGYTKKKKNNKRISASDPLLSSHDHEISSDVAKTEVYLNDSLYVTSNPAPRKSHMKALVKLNEVIESEQNDDEGNVDFNDDDDDEWNMEIEKNCVERDIPPKRKRGKQNNITSRLSLKDIESGVYDDPKLPFKCDVCTTRFRSEDRLAWHKKNVHASKNGDILACCICGRMFSTRLCFQSHYKRHENAEATEEGFDLWKKWPTLPKNPKKKKTQKKMVFNCKYCLMNHENHRSFRNHMDQD